MAHVPRLRLGRSRAVLAGYDKGRIMHVWAGPNFPEPVEQADEERRICFGDLSRFVTIDEAETEALRLINSTYWTGGELVARRCGSCRGYHLLMRTGG